MSRSVPVEVEGRVALLILLKHKIRFRDIKANRSKSTASQAYEDGLSKTQEQLLRRSLFGAISEAVETPGMARLFKSALELAYPQPGKPLFMIRIPVSTKSLLRS